MTSCERVSERMPAVAAGSPWTPVEASHLEQCPDCSAEWRLMGLARRVGGGLPGLDPDRVAAGVRSRLATEPGAAARSVRPVRWGRWVTGLAAAAVVVVALRAWPVRTEPATILADSGVVLTELDELSSSELEAVLGDLGGEVSIPAAGLPDLNDLSSEELERVLRAWEG